MNKNKRILIVDDDDSIRKTFFLILEKDYGIYSEKDPLEALKNFKKEKIDLIITDLKLPNINGLEMIERFRKSGYRGEVILISAYPDLINLEELNSLSVGHFFVKPLDLDSLNRSIDYILSPKKESERSEC